MEHPGLPHLAQLEALCLVAQTGGLADAAAALNMSSSAVRQKIKSLELHYGAKLTNSTRPITLTPVGEVLYRGAPSLLAAARELEAEVRSVVGMTRQSVTVGAIYSVGLAYLPDATREFRETHPGLGIEFRSGSSERVIELVLAREVDFGLISYPADAPELRARCWMRESMQLMCDAGHPLASGGEVTAADLRGMPMFRFATGLRLRTEIDRHLRSRGVTVRTSDEFDNAQTLVKAIIEHGGVGIVPIGVARRELADGTLRNVRCDDLKFERPLGFIFRRGERLSDAAAAYVEMLVGKRIDPARPYCLPEKVG